MIIIEEKNFTTTAVVVTVRGQQIVVHHFRLKQMQLKKKLMSIKINNTRIFKGMKFTKNCDIVDGGIIEQNLSILYGQMKP